MSDSSKRLVGPEHLRSLLHGALSKEPSCDGVTVPEIRRADLEGANWTCDMPSHWTGDCRRAFLAAKVHFQNLYDLETDD